MCVLESPNVHMIVFVVKDSHFYTHPATTTQPQVQIPEISITFLLTHPSLNEWVPYFLILLFLFLSLAYVRG